MWVAARRRLVQPNQLSPAQLLWGNPSLQQFRTLPDAQAWARRGVVTLGDVMHQGALLPMEDLIHKFQLPQWMWFRYLQL